MALFTISDLHLSLGEDKPMDFFEGWNDYERRIKDNWIKIVNENDTVVLPGDISWAMSLNGCIADFEFLNSLPGNKYILKGNHDYWWETITKMEKFFCEKGLTSIHFIHNNAVRIGDLALCGTRGWIFDAGKITENDRKIIRREAGRLEISLNAAKSIGGEPVVFMHYPPVFDNSRCADIMDVLKKYGVKRVYYGHIHGRAAQALAVNRELEGIVFRLVSCDYTDFCPVLVR